MDSSCKSCSFFGIDDRDPSYMRVGPKKNNNDSLLLEPYEEIATRFEPYDSEKLETFVGSSDEKFVETEDYLEPGDIFPDNVTLENINDPYGRGVIYKYLSPIPRALIRLLYGDLETFLNTPPGSEDILESYIIGFDHNMGDEDLVRIMGKRIGIYIPRDTSYTAAEIFIDKLVFYLLSVGKNDIPTYPQGGEIFPTTTQIINMSEEEFNNYLRKYEISPNIILYNDRLLVFTEMHDIQKSL